VSPKPSCLWGKNLRAHSYILSFLDSTSNAGKNSPVFSSAPREAQEMRLDAGDVTLPRKLPQGAPGGDRFGRSFRVRRSLARHYSIPLSRLTRSRNRNTQSSIASACKCLNFSMRGVQVRLLVCRGKPRRAKECGKSSPGKLQRLMRAPFKGTRKSIFCHRLYRHDAMHHHQRTVIRQDAAAHGGEAPKPNHDHRPSRP
jgi:hypothetical protein